MKRFTAFIRTHAVILLVAGLLLISFIFFLLWRGAQKQMDIPKDIAAKVGNLMVLPDEEPTVARVTDVSRLAGQAFFTRAKNGDRVLFFPKERLVVLYDPAANKIVNVGSVTPGSSPSAQTVGIQ